MKLNSLLLALLSSISSIQHVAAGDLCISESKVFNVVLHLYASELGYFTFKECPGIVNPTIGIEIGETYMFVQEDLSNWYHPMGFAYFPDGDHDGKDELEPGITQSGSDCASTSTCPTPRYFRDGVFLGNPDDSADFGLDVYENEFFREIVDWRKIGVYSIELNFDDFAYDKDIFYFCHIHQFMTGRIKLLKDGVPVNSSDEPPLGYEYDVPGEFDTQCGTYGLDDYVLPHPECLDRFVCLGDSSSNLQFASCIDAMNCAMMVGMTTQYESNSPLALFVHQMVPHHQNAVNMAKALLIDRSVVCSDITNDEDPDCQMEAVLRNIVATQNFQIQTMLSILAAKNFPETSDCVLEVPSTERIIEDVPKDDESDSQTEISKSVNEQSSSNMRITTTALSILLVMTAIVFFQ